MHVIKLRNWLRGFILYGMTETTPAPWHIQLARSYNSFSLGNGLTLSHAVSRVMNLKSSPTGKNGVTYNSKLAADKLQVVTMSLSIFCRQVFVNIESSFPTTQPTVIRLGLLISSRVI